MARWALRAPHYLSVEDWEWEYTETDRMTGRGRKLKFKVPRYLHPDDPNDVTQDGEIIVCHKDKGLPRDIVFFGSPTPDMEPLDEEALAISNGLKGKWIDAMGDAALPATGGFGDAMLAKLEGALNEIVNRLGIPKAENVSLKGADSDIFAKLQEQMAELIRKNAELEAKVNGQTLGPEPGEPIENELIEELPVPSTEVPAQVRRL